MNLSKNFTLEELCITHSGLPNQPDQEQIDNLTLLANKVLQPARDSLGKPISVNSGFRSTAVNMAVGGVATSQHCTGQAADIEAIDNAALFNLIHTSLSYDQLIWEGGNDKQPAWVHVSYRANNNRQQTLKMVVTNGKKSYISV
jgi:hypothetical protein